MIEEGDVFSALCEALVRLYEKDSALFEVNATERAIAHRIAVYLENEVAAWPGDWDVDCEYNRHGEAVKALDWSVVEELGAISPDDTEAKTVFPDIIVHRRREKKANALVIELKKVGGAPDSVDRAKVIAFTDPGRGFHYGWGVVLRLGPDGCENAAIFGNGKQVDDWTDRLQAELKEEGVLP